MENWTEVGFAGLAAGILWMTFKWMTSELNKKIDDLLDLLGSENEIGKNKGGDIKRNMV